MEYYKSDTFKAGTFLRVDRLVVDSNASLPDQSINLEVIQSGNNNEVLTTAGNTVLWRQPHLSIPDGAIQPTKIEAGDNGQVLTTVGGVTSWAPATGFNPPLEVEDIEAGDNNTVLRTNNNGDVEWSDSLTLDTINITNVANLPQGSVDVSGLTAGDNNTVLSTNNNGDVEWSDSLTLDTINITNVANLPQGSVDVSGLTAGANNTVLITDNSGDVEWSNILSVDTLIASNSINAFEGSISLLNASTMDLLDLNVTGNVTLPNESIVPNYIEAGANDTVLTTNASGNVVWAPPSGSGGGLTVINPQLIQYEAASGTLLSSSPYSTGFETGTYSRIGFINYATLGVGEFTIPASAFTSTLSGILNIRNSDNPSVSGLDSRIFPTGTDSPVVTLRARYPPDTDDIFLQAIVLSNSTNNWLSFRLSIDRPSTSHGLIVFLDSVTIIPTISE